MEILIVRAIIGLLAAITIPNYATARSRTQRTVCINNLRQIDSAKQEWALEMGKTVRWVLVSPQQLIGGDEDQQNGMAISGLARAFRVWKTLLNGAAANA